MTLEGSVQAGTFLPFDQVQSQPAYINAPDGLKAAAALEYFDKVVATQDAYKQAKPEQQQAAKIEFLDTYKVPKVALRSGLPTTQAGATPVQMTNVGDIQQPAVGNLYFDPLKTGDAITGLSETGRRWMKNGDLSGDILKSGGAGLADIGALGLRAGPVGQLGQALGFDPGAGLSNQAEQWRKEVGNQLLPQVIGGAPLFMGGEGLLDAGAEGLAQFAPKMANIIPKGLVGDLARRSLKDAMLMAGQNAMEKGATIKSVLDSAMSGAALGAGLEGGGKLLGRASKTIKGNPYKKAEFKGYAENKSPEYLNQTKKTNVQANAIKQMRAQARRTAEDLHALLTSSDAEQRVQGEQLHNQIKEAAKDKKYGSGRIKQPGNQQARLTLKELEIIRGERKGRTQEQKAADKQQRLKDKTEKQKRKTAYQINQAIHEAINEQPEVKTGTANELHTPRSGPSEYTEQLREAKQAQREQQAKQDKQQAQNKSNYEMKAALTEIVQKAKEKPVKVGTANELKTPGKTADQRSLEAQNEQIKQLKEEKKAAAKRQAELKAQAEKTTNLKQKQAIQDQIALEKGEAKNRKRELKQLKAEIRQRSAADKTLMADVKKYQNSKLTDLTESDVEFAANDYLKDVEAGKKNQAEHRLKTTFDAKSKAQIRDRITQKLKERASEQKAQAEQQNRTKQENPQGTKPDQQERQPEQPKETQSQPVKPQEEAKTSVKSILEDFAKAKQDAKAELPDLKAQLEQSEARQDDLNEQLAAIDPKDKEAQKPIKEQIKEEKKEQTKLNNRITKLEAYINKDLPPKALQSLKTAEEALSQGKQVKVDYIKDPAAAASAPIEGDNGMRTVVGFKLTKSGDITVITHTGDDFQPFRAYRVESINKIDITDTPAAKLTSLAEKTGASPKVEQAAEAVKKVSQTTKTVRDSMQNENVSAEDLQNMSKEIEQQPDQTDANKASDCLPKGGV